MDEHVGKAHDTQAYFPGLAGHILDLLKWIFIDFNDIIQEPDGQFDGFPELVEINFRLPVQLYLIILERLIEPRLQDS